MQRRRSTRSRRGQPRATATVAATTRPVAAAAAAPPPVHYGYSSASSQEDEYEGYHGGFYNPDYEMSDHDHDDDRYIYDNQYDYDDSSDDDDDDDDVDVDGYENDYMTDHGFQRLVDAMAAATAASNQREQAARTPLAPPPTTLCRFFVLGKCRYGSQCTYSHTIPASASAAGGQQDEQEVEQDNDVVMAKVAATMVDCPFFQRGNCRFGDYCRLRHSATTTTSLGTGGGNNQRGHSSGVGGSSSSSRAAAGATSQPAAGGARHNPSPPLSASTTHHQQDHTCGICFEDVVEVGKYFGLLSCDHCFCLECLRKWRQSKEMEAEVTRSCPACRSPSNYIVPSLHFCTGAAKDTVVDAYKRHLAIRECKYFNGRYGSCPFGPNCFYAHRNSRGEDVKHLDLYKKNPSNRHHRQRSDSEESFDSIMRRAFNNRINNGGGAGRLPDVLATMVDQYVLRFLQPLGWDENE